MSASSRGLGKNKARSVYGPEESVRAIFAEPAISDLPHTFVKRNEFLLA